MNNAPSEPTKVEEKKAGEAASAAASDDHSFEDITDEAIQYRN